MDHTCNEILTCDKNLWHQGIVEDKPDLLKQRVGYDYNNPLAFIEGMLPPELQQLKLA